MAERRSQLQSLVEPMGILLGATGTHPWADWKQQRIIDTPHYRRNDELLRYVVWRNNTFGLHVHVAIRGADRAIAVLDGDAELPAGDPRALGELTVRRGRQLGPALGAHADLHALLPALRRPRLLRLLGGVRALRAVPLRHGLDHGAHADLVERAAAPRVPHDRDSHRGRAAGPRRGAGARGLRRVARRARRARIRRGAAPSSRFRTG